MMDFLPFIAVFITLLASLLVLVYGRIKVGYGFLLIGVMIICLLVGNWVANINFNFKAPDYYNFGEANGYNRGFRDGMAYQSDNYTIFPTYIYFSEFD